MTGSTPSKRNGTRSGAPVRRAAKAAVGSAAFAAGVLFLTGTAHAADDAAPDTSATTTPDPADSSLWIPASPAPDAVVDSTTPSDPAPDTTPTDDTGTATTTDPSTPADGATTTTDQDATVDNTGTSTGNTGTNTAIGNTNGGATQAQSCPTSGTQAAVICTTAPNGAAGVSSGNSGAQGTNSTGGIAQITNIATTGNGKVDVLQVALIIDIGIGLSNSGTNAAGAGGGPSLGVAGSAGIGTGNATVTGLLGNTQVVQGVTVVGGSTNNQSVTVVNIGIGIGNTGLNLAAGSVTGDGQQEVAAGGSPGNGSAGIDSGNANALGDNSGSLIMQVVTVTAADDGSISIVQRAVIVNFGLALANSGANTALSAMAGLPGEQQAFVQNLIAALFGLDPATLFGGGTAAIGTGDAGAIGNQSQSSVLQSVQGAVTGSDTASANQSAWIGNFGAALANTGMNGAVGTLEVLPDGSPMGTAEQMIARFLSILTDPSVLHSSDADMNQALDLGSALLQLRGDISGTETLAGLDEGEAWETADGGVRIRQITGVLNIAIALANSGDNVAVSHVDGAGLETLDPAASQILGTAGILTGTADVLGLRAKVCVTQTIGDPDVEAACANDTPGTPDDPGTPTPPVEVDDKTQTNGGTGGPTGTLPTSVEAATVTAGPGKSLAFTGGSLELEALLGLALTGGGILIQRRARRSNTDRVTE